ncbi:MAG TPA: hypothetical protein VJW20_07810 [Candidatus Angelobacter sp.]|nr:hypothetical protein [Candidatus Angelobacter sp.]
MQGNAQNINSKLSITQASWLNSICGEEESEKISGYQRCESGVARRSGDAAAGATGREQEAQSKRKTQKRLAQMACGSRS